MQVLAHPWTSNRGKCATADGNLERELEGNRTGGSMEEASIPGS